MLIFMFELKYLVLLKNLPFYFVVLCFDTRADGVGDGSVKDHLE